MKKLYLFLIILIQFSTFSEDEKKSSGIEELLKADYIDYWKHTDLNQKLTLDEVSKYADLKSLKQNCDELISLIIKKDFDGFFKDFSRHSPLPKNEIEYIKSASVKHFQLLENRVGKLLGYEFGGMEKVSDSIVKFTYFIKGNIFPIRWIFYGYKPQEAWYVFTFFWDYCLENDLALFQMTQFIQSVYNQDLNSKNKDFKPEK